MSVIKIEQDIQLLEQKLEKINIAVPDPIERNEQKQELERKLKKLRRTKNQIEQQEIYRQELESFKSEFQSNNNKAVEIEEPKVDLDRQIEIAKEEVTPKITDRSLSADLTGDHQNKKKPWIKIQLFIILGLILTTAIGISFAVSSNYAQKAEAARLKELAKQEAMKAETEAEKAKQERKKAAAAIEEAERARQLAIQAKKETERARIIAKEAEKTLRRREVKTTYNTDFPSGEFGDRDWLISLWYANNTYYYRGQNRRTGDSISLHGVRVSGNSQRRIYTWNNQGYRYQIIWQPSDASYIRLQVLTPNGKQLLNRLLRQTN